jgi:hypothetical protein
MLGDTASVVGLQKDGDRVMRFESDLQEPAGRARIDAS